MATEIGSFPCMLSSVAPACPIITRIEYHKIKYVQQKVGSMQKIWEGAGKEGKRYEGVSEKLRT